MAIALFLLVSSKVSPSSDATSSSQVRSASASLPSSSSSRLSADSSTRLREVDDLAVELARHLVEAVLDELAVERRAGDPQHAGAHREAAVHGLLDVVRVAHEADDVGVELAEVLEHELLAADVRVRCLLGNLHGHLTAS